MDVGRLCHKCGRGCPTYPRDPRPPCTDLRRMFADHVKLARFVPPWNTPRPSGYRSGGVRGGAGSRASRRWRAGERAGARGARTRSPAASASSSPRGRSSATAAPRWPRSPPRPASDARRSTATSPPARTSPRRSRRKPNARRRAEPQPSSRLAPLPYQAPGRLGRAQPLALEVTHVLDEVPPHLIADQLVAEARRAAGVAVALYVVDIDGSQLIRLAGSEDFPESWRRRRRWARDRARGAAVVLRAAQAPPAALRRRRRCGCAAA